MLVPQPPHDGGGARCVSLRGTIWPRVYDVAAIAKTDTTSDVLQAGSLVAGPLVQNNG